MICHLFEEPKFLIFASGLPDLLYYSHIPAAVISLLIGLFVFLADPKSLLNRLLLVIAGSFSLWTFFSLITWTNIHSEVVLFVWSFFGLLYGLISISSIYFVSVFLNKRDVGPRHKLAFLLLLLPVVIFAPTSLNLSGFNLTLCDSSGFENFYYLVYYNLLGGIAMVWILLLGVQHYLKSAKGFRHQVLLMCTGIELFLFSFFVTGFLSSYLADKGIFVNYELEMYGLFSMVIFMGLIAFMIVRFRAFNVELLAAQALVVALIIVIGSEFAFVRNPVNLILVAITLVLTGVIGLLLIRSVRAEIEQRERAELFASELEKSNKQQVILIHFITHQIKGFVTKSRNIFSVLLDGDCGEVPATMKPMLEEGLRSDTKGVNTIQEILNAANIKSGRVSYTKSPVDLRNLIETVGTDLKNNADTKGLAFTLSLGTEAITIQGDSMQLTNAFKNLIDNSIKYTPSGSVTVNLSHEDKKARVVIEDTGVGITKEDMQRLFTEGGHGANSQKINVESTGFGLYIVKNIIEAHGGKVWAESEGEGKGSRFVAELPL